MKFYFKILLTYIRNIVYYVYMTMIRKAILKRMDELKMNPNQLSEQLKGSIPRMTIYDFLSGKADARTEVAAEIMKALGLEIVPKKRQKR